VILLVITVAAFAVLFLMVQGVPKPSAGVAADLQATLEHPTTSTAQVVINHLGGADLKDQDAAVVIAINNTTLTYNISQGLGSGSVWSVGKTWRIWLPLPVGPDTRVVVSVVSYVANSIVYAAELQAGYTASGGGFPPIVAPAWAVASDNSNEVRNDGTQTYRIHAIVIDPDGNLNTTGGVWAEISVTPQGPALSTASIGAGRFNLTRTEGSHFQSPDLVMAPSIPTGSYQITVRAQDAAAGMGSALTPPLKVVSASVGGGPSLWVSGGSIAPISINTSASDVGVIRLNVTAQGGDAALGQVIVSKTGSLADSQVTLALWADGDGSGTFDAAADVELTPPTGFTAGTSSIAGFPIWTVPGGSTRVLFVVASLLGAADGTNMTLALEDAGSMRGSGIPGGLPATTDGAFPIASSDVVVGSKLSLEFVQGTPDRLLANTNNVRLFDFDLRAAGEPFNIKRINITLTGTIPRSNAQCYIKVNGQMIAGAQSFDPSRVARFSVNFPVLDTAGTLPMEVFLNVTGKSAQTVGIRVAAETDTFAQGQITSKGRNGKSTTPFPIDSGLVTLTTTGNISIDEFNDTALSTPVRAGLSNLYLHTFKVRAHGESVDFNRLIFYQTGNLTDGQFAAVTVRLRGGAWFSGTFFAGVVTWDAGSSGKLFNIPLNVTNSGEAVFDVYTNLTTGTQGKEFSLSILDSNKVRGWGKTSLTVLYANTENAPFPLTVGARRIQGDVLFWGGGLASTTILAPATLVPVLKLTARAVGENMSLEELYFRSTLGVPAVLSSVTVHLYRDVNNDTTTSVQGDDVDLSTSEAGPFGADTLKAFSPGASLTVGVDASFYIALDFTASAAGFSVETRTNLSNATIRGLYSNSLVPANAQIGITNPPALIYQTPPVPVVDRGSLSMVGSNVNAQNPLERASTGNLMLRLNATAAVESVRVDAVKVHLLGDISAGTVTAHLWWDKDKSGTLNAGDAELGASATFAAGDVTFSASPLLTVAAGSQENLLVVIDISAGAALGSTCGVEVTASSFVTALGIVSTLGIIPSGSFAMTSPAVTVST
jgi:hypothetical protein